MSQVIEKEDFKGTYFKVTNEALSKFDEIFDVVSIRNLSGTYYIYITSQGEVIYTTDKYTTYKEITYNELTGHFEHVKDDKYKLIPIETYNNMIKQVNMLVDRCEDQKKFIINYIDLNTTERDELEELRTLKKLLDNNDDTTIKQTLQRVQKVLKWKNYY